MSNNEESPGTSHGGPGRRFRDTASSGKRLEFVIIGRLLKEGYDVYIPLVDDHGVDCILKLDDGTFIEVQIKARTKECSVKEAALFAALNLLNPRPNYYYVFYSERMEMTWVVNSVELLEAAYTNKEGKHKGKRSIWFNGMRGGVPHPKPQFEKYRVTDFSAFRQSGAHRL